MKQSAEQIQPEVRQTRPEKEAAVAVETMEAAEVVEEQDAKSAAAEVTAVKELVASILPKTVKTPEEQKKADEMAKQAAFKAALAAATHPNRHFIR